MQGELSETTSLEIPETMPDRLSKKNVRQNASKDVRLDATYNARWNIK